ncbi:unnamed protein product [Plutella xylostella]|uniref:(diamondback moth) hypothetical protein n=1 Tax=Plutella xylostella TaxID=51655 RepID=A0A8S4FS93_PLUXY|nr:unnamed protein product [Plutella xylostella]
MRDSMKPCHHTVSEDVVYKEVVVIGNGPSGMVTSFMLAGNEPYLKTPIPDDLPIDEMLRARLSHVPAGQSLYEEDLLALAEGLEGRSQNPLPLLMDTLLRPCADMGIPADPLIEWRFDVEKKIEHIVLGRGPPGGAWHTFPPRCSPCPPARGSACPRGAPRLRSACLPELWRSIVWIMSMSAICRGNSVFTNKCPVLFQRYFRSGVLVTSVEAAARAPGPPCVSAACPLNANWTVSGYDKSSGRPFRYSCSRVVVACGGSDRANSLPRAPPRALHQLSDVQRGVAALKCNMDEDPSFQPTVLVIGSGVSAADAVCLSRSHGAVVALAHRDPAPALAALSPRLYPEHSEVYKMMCDGTAGTYKNYIPLPEHVILKVKPAADKRELTLKPEDADLTEALKPKTVRLLNIVTNEIVVLTVHLIAVLIGSKPDLFFLQPNFDLDCINIDRGCPKCSENKKPKMEEDTQTQCFLKNHWHYLKSVLGQSIQSCKSRYLSGEINGNDTKCIVEECSPNNNEDDSCTCNKLVSKLDANGSVKTVIDKECKCQIIPYRKTPKSKCQCQDDNPYSGGIGFGVDPKKPVDCRSNPIAVDRGTHEMLNAPKGMYALGPLTGDNFIRFIPGGALAIVADIQKARKLSPE